MASVIIESARIVYGPGHVECECSIPVSTILGEKSVMQWIALIEADTLPNPDWTDADLCAAVAAIVQIDATEVIVRSPTTS